MKQKFSTAWKASKKPRKQRKYSANAPLHIKRKILSVNLSKDLRKKHNTRNAIIRKGDSAKVTRGNFKGKKGKITEVKIKMGKIYLEGIQRTKSDGSKVNVPIKASNLQITDLNLEDKKRNIDKNKTHKNTEKAQEITKTEKIQGDKK